VQGRLLLNVVVGKGAAVLELLASEDQALLVRRNALLVLNLGLDIVDGVRRLNLKGDGLAGEGLNDCGELVKEYSKDSGSEWGGERTDLHATTEAQDQVQGRLLLDVVVGESTAILKLLASKDQALLVGRDALLVLDLGLDIVDGVAGLHLKGDSLAGD